MKYTVEIEFETEKHCLWCPLRDDDTDNCKMQYCGSDGFDSWEEQMKNCPLKLVEEHCPRTKQASIKCRYCSSKNVEIIARGTESILYRCKACKRQFVKLNIKEDEP